MVIKNKSFQKNRSKLYIVGTPIGNLQDISLRALEVLKTVDVIYCEDTSNTVRLLSAFNIKKPLHSLHEHNENQLSQQVIDKVKAGENVAYVSDAGNPLISDPGSQLTVLSKDQDIDVVTVLGPSAFLHALINSGFSTDNFIFRGFVPREDSIRDKMFKDFSSFNETQIFYEAPHRIGKTLNALAKALPEREICLARELTKIHEEFIFGTASELAELDSTALKGEIVIVIKGAVKKKQLENTVDILKIFELLKTKMSTKDIIDYIVSFYGLKKNQVYETIEEYKKNS